MHLSNKKFILKKKCVFPRYFLSNVIHYKFYIIIIYSGYIPKNIEVVSFVIQFYTAASELLREMKVAFAQ